MPGVRIPHRPPFMEALTLVFIRYRNQYLILKRPAGALSFPELWETISTSEKMSVAELTEYVADILGIQPEGVSSMREVTFIQADQKTDGHRYYIADLGTPFIEIGYDYTKYEWIQPRQIGTYKTIPGLAEDFEKIKHY
jgi:hypothetical protein